MDLLNPHLFTQEQLFNILNERNVNILNLHNKTRDELLEIYFSYVLPLHQRSTKNSSAAIGEINIEKLNIGSSNHRLKMQSSESLGNNQKHTRIDPPNGTPVSNNIKINGNSLKRSAETGMTEPVSKHKKITWP